MFILFLLAFADCYKYSGINLVNVTIVYDYYFVKSINKDGVFLKEMSANIYNQYQEINKWNDKINFIITDQIYEDKKENNFFVYRYLDSVYAARYGLHYPLTTTGIIQAIPLKTISSRRLFHVFTGKYLVSDKQKYNYDVMSQKNNFGLSSAFYEYDLCDEHDDKIILQTTRSYDNNLSRTRTKEIVIGPVITKFIGSYHPGDVNCSVMQNLVPGQVFNEVVFINSGHRANVNLFFILFILLTKKIEI